MNTIKSLSISIIACLSIQYSCLCDEIITMFFYPYPMAATNDHGRAITERLKRPGEIASHSMHGILEKDRISGIFATYGGYLSSSDSVGQISFPRRHEKPRLYLVITDKITPSVLTENTLSHWQFEPGTAAQMYSVTRERDAQSGLSFWNVQEELLPENNHIPLESIIIFARPKDMYVPTGISLTRDKPNLVLPDVFVKKGIKIYANTLYVLNIKHFFGPLGSLYKTTPTSYIRLLNP